MLPPTGPTAMVCLFAVLLLGSSVQAKQQVTSRNAASSPVEFLDNTYLISYTSDEEQLVELMKSTGCPIQEIWTGIRVASISIPDIDRYETLRHSKYIATLVRDISVHWVNALRSDLNIRVQAAADNTVTRKSTDAEFFDIQWGLHQIDVEQAWKISRGQKTVRVAILDTGISPDHVDLEGKYDLTASVNLSQANPADRMDYIDRHFHGTHVSALIASNNLGIASAAPDVTLVGVKVLDDEGYASFRNLIAGVMYAVDDARADIINMSLGGVGTTPVYLELAELLHRAIDYAESNGVVVVVSSGNHNIDLQSTGISNLLITDEAGTLLVGASAPLTDDGEERRACYSNYGSGFVGIVAPGGNVECAEGSYTSMSDMVLSAMAPAVARKLGLANPTGWYMFSAGTSMAAPLVSSVAALVKSLHPEMDAGQIATKIKLSADDLGTRGVDEEYGYGRINAANALR